MKNEVGKYSRSVYLRITRKALFLFFILHSSLFLFTSCARMGQPDGGWYDENPPRIVSTSPEDQSTGVSSKRIVINFDEYIQIDNPTEKVVISPPQLEQADIKGQGKRILVVLKDSLKENTTYTIDFSDAITDNNENNPLGNYTYTFSTGDHIDTLQVAGYVLEAENLEPIKGILVGLIKVPEDIPTDSVYTLFRREPLLRVSRTDESGHFVIKGVAEGNYRVYALSDADGDYRLSQKSEKMAYNTTDYTPTWKPDIRQDTLWLDSLHIKDIAQVNYTHFLPDDVVLRAFTEKQTDRFFLKSERKDADRFTFFFSYGHPEVPKVRGLNFNSDDAFIIESSVNNDTVTYWLRDTMLVNQDTLQITVDYMATDTLGVLQLQTDTLEMLAKVPYEKRLKQQTEQIEKWQKQQERNRKRGKAVDNDMPGLTFDPEYNVPSTIDPDQNIYFTVPKPLERIDTAGIQLYEKQDTTWYRSHFLFGERTGYPRTYQLIAEWKPGTEYSFEVDSAAMTDIYGCTSKPYKHGLKVKQTDEYSTIIVTIEGLLNDSVQAVVQLLSGSDKVVKELSTENGVATFYYVKPGTYYMRAFIDDNANGLWDTGDYNQQRQPEAVYYYPSKIECRAKWDVPIKWRPDASPLYTQKPREIVKQKSDNKRKTLTNRNLERARKLGIEYNP